MTKLLNSTSTVQLWHDIIHEAETICDITLDEAVESYLIFMIIRYTATPDIVHHAMAADFLKGLQLGANQREVKLQAVGDKCLIFSGFFPKIAEKRRVKISYFVQLGQSSYATIAKDHGDVYWRLANQFTALMDILQSVRHSAAPDLLPLEAYELWTETGSKRAFTILQSYTRNKPSKQ